MQSSRVRCKGQDIKIPFLIVITLCVKMSGVKARKWVLRSQFSGQPKREDLEIVEEELPPIKDGGQRVKGRKVWVAFLQSY